MMFLTVALATVAIASAVLPMNETPKKEAAKSTQAPANGEGEWKNPLVEPSSTLYAVEPGLEGVEELIRGGRWSRAAEVLGKKMDSIRDPRLKPYARFVQGVAMYSSGRYKDAAHLLGQTVGKVPEVANWVRYYQGFSRFNQEEYIAAYDNWGAIEGDFPLKSYVDRLRCVSLSRATRREAFLKRAEEFRQANGEHPQLAVAEARTLVYMKRWEEAAERAKWVRTNYPAGSEGKEAAEVVELIKAAGHRDLISLKWSEQLKQAHEFYDAYWYKMALSLTSQLMTTLEKAGEKKGELWCRALGLHASTMARQRNHTKSLPYFNRFVRYCPEYLTDEVLYRGAEAARKAGNHKYLARWVDVLIKRFPKSSLCDDALVFLARAQDRDGDRKGVEKTIKRLFEKFPDGDLAAEGAWMLVFAQYKAGHLKKVIELADEFQDRLPERQNYKTDGRLLYWKGRSAQKLKKKKLAKEAWTQVLKLYPLSWYSLLAYQRLEGLEKGLWESIMAGLRAASVPLLPTREEVEEQLTSAAPGVKRGIVLLNLGLSESAGYEFKQALGKEKDSDDLRKRLLSASLYDRVGYYSLSHHLLRRRVGEYGYSYPQKEDDRWWKVAYPPAFLEIVQEQSKDSDVPWNLIMGIMREESGFDPKIESYAHAVGLMQLLLKTASWVAKRDVSRGQLQDPERNIRLGVGFLEYLFGKFDHPAMVVAGYNSGPGGVFKTLKRYSGNEVDEFVEHIPYDQTRRYTKRVLSSAWRYQVLYEKLGVVPFPMTFKRP